MKQSFKDILAGVDRDISSKVAAKLPLWADAGLEYPSRLNLEQCSSSEAAAFKAKLSAGFGRIADLTGGLGSDTFAFSKVAESVWYNERDTALAEAVKRNMAKLGISNILFNSFDINPLTDEWLRELQSFGPDLIFLDPARRNAEGKKVFLLEDCSPDVVALLPSLLEVAPTIMVKLSPMADISMVCNRLGGHVSDVYVVGLAGECKELLCVIGCGSFENPLIHVIELGKGELTFSPEEEAVAAISYPSRDIKGFLLEPMPSVLKSGLRKLPCARFGLIKLSRDTNLYVSSDASAATESGLFKTYKILEVCSFDKQSCKSIASRYPTADVSARGIPMTSEALRTRLGVRDANNGIHIFGVGVNLSDGTSTRLLLITERV